MATWLTRQRVLAAIPLFLLFAAWNRDNDLLYFLCALSLTVALLAFGLPWLQLRRVTVARSQPGTGYEGTPSPWMLRVRNHSWWPRFMLQITDRLPPQFEGAMPPTLAVGLVWPRSVRVLRGEVRYPRRGFYQLGPLALHTAFPVGLVDRHVAVPDSSREVLVYPRLFRVTRMLVPESGGARRAGHVQLAKPGGDTDFWGVREYRRGDSPRRVHWRASARYGELVVKEFERTADHTIMFVIDMHRDFNVGAGAESSFEYAVRIAASLARFAFGQGWAIGLTGSGQHAFELAPARGEAHFRRMLEMLARVECDGFVPYAQIVERAMAVTGRSGLAVLFGLENRTAEAAGGGVRVPRVADGMGRVVIALDRGSFMREPPRTRATPLAPAVGRTEVVYRFRCGDDLERAFAGRG